MKKSRKDFIAYWWREWLLLAAGAVYLFLLWYPKTWVPRLHALLHH